MKKRTSIIVAACTAAALALGGIGVYAAGQLTKAAAITEEDAYRFALADAGVNAENASFLHAEYEIEQGTPVYDVEFVADGVEYDYDIKAEDGTVLKKEADPVRSSDRTVPAAPADPAASEPIPADAPVPETPAAGQTAAVITEEEAVAAALEKAGKGKDEVVFTEIRRDHDDGREVYDIEFTVPGEAEYDYEIDAVTGEIREHLSLVLRGGRISPARCEELRSRRGTAHPQHGEEAGHLRHRRDRARLSLRPVAQGRAARLLPAADPHGE